MSDETTSPILIITSSIIIVFNLFMIFIYIKNKKLKSFHIYFNIFFCTVIFLSNIIRLLKVGNFSEGQNAFCQIQAVLLAILDKLIIYLISNYSMIFYLGIIKNNFFVSNGKKIYIILPIISLTISIVLAIIFFSVGGYAYQNFFCYVNISNDVEKILDTIVTTLFLIISIYSLIVVLINIISLKNIFQKEQVDMNNKFKHQIIRFCFILIINILIYIYIIFINNELFSLDKYIEDSIYLLLCLIFEIFLIINERIIIEAKNIFTCKNNDFSSFPDSSEDKDYNALENINEKDANDQKGNIMDEDNNMNNNIISNNLDNENIINDNNKIFNEKVNIKFLSCTGIDVNIDVELDKTVEEIIKLFFNVINRPNLFGDKSIYFVCNGSPLKQNSKIKIGNAIPLIKNGDKIVVTDVNNKINCVGFTYFFG